MHCQPNGGITHPCPDHHLRQLRCSASSPSYRPWPSSPFLASLSQPSLAPLQHPSRSCTRACRSTLTTGMRRSRRGYGELAPFSLVDRENAADLFIVVHSIKSQAGGALLVSGRACLRGKRECMGTPHCRAGCSTQNTQHHLLHLVLQTVLSSLQRLCTYLDTVSSVFNLRRVLRGCPSISPSKLTARASPVHTKMQCLVWSGGSALKTGQRQGGSVQEHQHPLWTGRLLSSRRCVALWEGRLVSCRSSSSSRTTCCPG